MVQAVLYLQTRRLGGVELAQQRSCIMSIRDVTIRDHDQHTTTNTQPDFGFVLIKDRTKFEGSKMCHIDSP